MKFIQIRALIVKNNILHILMCKVLFPTKLYIEQKSGLYNISGNMEP